MTVVQESISAVKIKTCRKCATLFSGRYCKECAKVIAANWRKLNPGYKRKNRQEYDSIYRAANKDKLKESAADYRALHKKEIYAKNKKWISENRDKSKAYSAKYREKNPGKANADSKKYSAANRDKINSANALRYAKNPERINLANAAWRLRNPEKAKASVDAWQIANPESLRINNLNRRAKKLENGGKLSKGLSEKLFKLQKGKCVCCGKPLGDDFHLDHRMPLALGGANTDDNMQLLTAKCNMQKHARHPIEFMQSRGFLL